jgi:ribosomal protein S18 acetylase RimI-like enzyme
MTIKELKIELMDDWFEFFETRAFEDHAEWRGCYCTAFFYPKPAEYSDPGKRRKDYARWLIETGRMAGYMAYEKGKVIGWVNANDKAMFTRLAGMKGESGKILSIVCFLVEKAHRGKGIASKLLERILKDAEARGFSAIEAYPKKRARSEFGTWNGPFGMYERRGFIEQGSGDGKVVRKRL